MEKKKSINRHRSSTKNTKEILHNFPYDLERIKNLSTTTDVQANNVIHVSVKSSDHRKMTSNRLNSQSTEIRVTPLKKKNTGLKQDNKKQNLCKKRHLCLAKCCPCCNLFRIVSSIIITLLLGIAIAALLMGLLMKQNTTAMSTTTTTTAMSTTTTTTATSTTQTTATTTTSTTTTTTATTTTTTRMTIITTTTEIIYGIWNTSAGSDSTPSTSGTSNLGNYYPGEIPQNVFDNTTSTKYTNFGGCIFTISSTYSVHCGKNTGFYFTNKQGSSLLLSVQFCTANDIPQRDPFTITIEGSNKISSLLTLGSSWTLIYNGTTDLQLISSRFTCGTAQSIMNNSIWYTSYRILVTSKRSSESGTQYSEIRLVGYI